MHIKPTECVSKTATSSRFSLLSSNDSRKYFYRMDLNVESCAWVFDSLVGFLHGPIWNVPLQTFIEEKSLPFEPTDNGEVDDRPEYKKIHDEYRNLVDMMLGSFMEDIGITAEQFEEACRLSRGQLEGLPLQFHRRLFEQVWAANDYTMFTKMMTHKNVELQLQALELIERRFGALPQIFMSDDLDYPEIPQGGDEEWPEKDDIMNEIRKLELSDSSDSEDVIKAPERAPVDVIAEKKILKSKLVSFEENIPEETDTDTKVSDDSGGRGVDAVDAAAKSNDYRSSPPAKQEVSAEDVKQRQEYLKRQRDKLLALKRQVRERRLDGGAGEAARPASARAARALLSGAPAPAPTATSAAVSDGSMQLRRALVDRLKSEVVDRKH